MRVCLKQPHVVEFENRKCWTMFVVLSLLCALPCGCTTLSLNVLNRSAKLDDNIAQQNAPTYKVITQGRSGQKPKIYEGRIESGLFVQQALENSGAIRRHRNMLVDLARVAPETGRIIRLPVTYDAAKKRVSDEQNYAVHDGDEILVRPANPGPFDALLGAITGQDPTDRRSMH